MDVDLNPAQAALLSRLRDGDRPEFGPGLADRLRLELHEGLEPVLDHLPDGEDLWLSKHTMSQALGCEGLFIHDDAQPFEWTVPTARGTVSHKAIEYSVFSRLPREPLTLVTEAIGALSASDGDLARFLTELTPTERAELESEANARVAAFLDGWPPLKRSWTPVLEARVRVDLFGKRIVLSGRQDIALGTAVGARAGKVSVDLKSGASHAGHRDDARFYALLETLRYGVPPFRVGTYYLESGELATEDVDEDILDATVARVVGAAHAVVELRHAGRAPELRPGPACAWCPLRHDCEVRLDPAW